VRRPLFRPARSEAERLLTAKTAGYRIAFLSLDPAEDASRLLERLRELGYAEGKNLTFVQRSAEGDPSRLRALAEELVRGTPDVIVAGWGTLAPKAINETGTTIPMVFSAVGDPVGAGLVKNLARPGGNMTGLSAQASELEGKKLQILKEAIPGQKVVGFLLNPDTPYTAIALAQLRMAAQGDDTRLELLEVRTSDEFSAARLEALVAKGATSLFVFEDPLSRDIRHRIFELATKLRLPTMAGNRDYAAAGALLTYGWYWQDGLRRTAEYVDRILNGAHPGDLPVEQPTRFQFVLNLKTAKTLGLVIPPTLLARADEVIE
jgi:putative ABC transport system substrate-binding protein